MNESSLRELMSAVATGQIPPDVAVAQLARLPFADLGFAKIDHHRSLRQGLPEAVFGRGKSPEQTAVIVAELLEHGEGPVIVTRADDEQALRALTQNPGGAQVGTTLYWRAAAIRNLRVAIVTAGTVDLPVAEECVATLNAHGVEPTLHLDCGVAGVHRLFAELDSLREAQAVVVVAGMEGALASIIGGLVSAPLVAVPTSTGYGSAFEGITALLGMLSSCASGLTVVGIDNGFGAACAVMRLLNQVDQISQVDRPEKGER